MKTVNDIRKEFLKFIIKGSNFSIDISKSYFNFNNFFFDQFLTYINHNVWI